MSIKNNFSREEKGEPKRIEPRSLCLPAKRLTARPHRLTGKEQEEEEEEEEETEEKGVLTQHDFVGGSRTVSDPLYPAREESQAGTKLTQRHVLGWHVQRRLPVWPHVDHSHTAPVPTAIKLVRFEMLTSRQTVQYRTVEQNTIQYNTIQYNTMRRTILPF